jgi:hypothetical protein
MGEATFAAAGGQATAILHTTPGHGPMTTPALR